MQETIAVLAMAFGTALLSASGASELAVALLVAAALLVIVVHGIAPHHEDADALHDQARKIGPQQS
jgi:hypothetical protein